MPLGFGSSLRCLLFCVFINQLPFLAVVSVCPEMRNFLQDRGMREFNPQEYCMYFEDLNLSMTKRLEKITISGQALVSQFPGAMKDGKGLIRIFMDLHPYLDVMIAVLVRWYLKA